jgi:hypothetical protein
MKVLLLMLSTLGAITGSVAQQFTLVEKPNEKKLHVLYDGKLVTAYCYFDSTEKPVLFPIKTLSGTTVTRGFPIAPRQGERTDHPHHTGLWLNYESVNGLDFWNNSYAIAEEKKSHYGSIKHQEIIDKKTDHRGARFSARSHWVDQAGNVLLEEVTDFAFKAMGSTLVIDRTSTLVAKQDSVVFADVKDGLLGIRVARELELPSTQEDKFVDASGNVTTVAKASAEGVTGNYVNQHEEKGDAVWGKRAVWTCLTGQIRNEKVGIGIIDHPSNVGYPAYWHARGYGLFAVNPLGQKIFSNGKENLHFTLRKGESRAFTYRIIIHAGSALSKELMTNFNKDFINVKPLGR